jgi:hypothetical protein
MPLEIRIKPEGKILSLCARPSKKNEKTKRKNDRRDAQKGGAALWHRSCNAFFVVQSVRKSMVDDIGWVFGEGALFSPFARSSDRIVAELESA